MTTVNDLELYFANQQYSNDFWRGLDVFVDDSMFPAFDGLSTQNDSVTLYDVKEYDLSILGRNLPEGVQPIPPAKIVELPRGIFDLATGALMGSIEFMTEELKTRNAILNYVFGEFIHLEEDEE